MQSKHMETQHFSAHCIFTLLTLWTHGAHPPLSSPVTTACLLCTGGGHAQVQRADGNWFCLGPVSIYQIPAWSLQRRKVGGMKCAGDLAVDFNCAFYDFLISYVRKMLRRM